jgi:hypothetical protein
MEKLTEVIEIRVTPGPIVGWLEKITILENDTIIAERLERKNFFIGSEPIPENTPDLVIQVIEALAEINWPFTPINLMP